MKTKTLVRLRIGRIRYTNTLPFYHSLESLLAEEGFTLDWTVGSPVQINEKIRGGEVDIAPISSLEYLLHQEEYLLFPKLCIGSRDFSASVLLLSKEKIEGLKNSLISLSEESLSAAALLKILLKFKFNFNNRFRSDPSHPTHMLSRADACLVIGDEALFFRPTEFVYKTDLSEVWWEWTNLPFCFSVWAVRKSYYHKHEEEAHLFYRCLKTNLEKNLQDLERLLREGLGLTLSSERFPTVFGYLFNLNYGLDPLMQEGLKLFFDYAHRLGIAPQSRKFEFVGV